MRKIELRGVEVNNLKGIDLDIPYHRLIAVCGVSGSGKSSLALDTLYAEGQRRYIESFSAHARQFLEKLNKPAAQRIDGAPAAIAVTKKKPTAGLRSTVGTATEIADHLRLMFARIGRLVCPTCKIEARRDSPDTAAEDLLQASHGRRFMIAFPPPLEESPEDRPSWLASMQKQGFVRAVIEGQIVEISQSDGDASKPLNEVKVIVDRLVAGKVAGDRLRDSLETAFQQGGGSCFALLEGEQSIEAGGAGTSLSQGGEAQRVVSPIDGQPWRVVNFHDQLHCRICGVRFTAAQPRMFSFNHPLGACPQCEGAGQVLCFDRSIIAPDSRQSLQQGVLAPLEEPQYADERKQLLSGAAKHGLPLDTPLEQLDPAQREAVFDGAPSENESKAFEGVLGVLRRLEAGKQTAKVRSFLQQWRSFQPCPECRGARLNEQALAWRVGGKSIAEIASLTAPEASEFFSLLELDATDSRIAKTPLEHLRSRLRYLTQVGAGYLTLDRPLSTLSSGEAQRVSLSTALGSNLVNMMYVLDEPTAGLHPADARLLMEAIHGLQSRGNTVVMVEHQQAALQEADHIVEIGPGAGDDGGQIVFQGSLEQLVQPGASLTGEYLAGRRGAVSPKRRPPRGVIQLKGARGHNLRGVDVEFPLGVLCVVTGVSGAGKSSLVQGTLYGALCRRLHQGGPTPLPFEDVLGHGQIDEVVLMDHTPLSGSSRSNPVTYIKVFDEIRNVFAETLDAKTRNYPAGYFSFNVDGGRCNACRGEGEIAVDMQFLPEVRLVCSQCGGARFRKEILQVTHRGRSIADVLQMTVREAFSFFRGQPKVQTRLKHLIDVGLEYLRLGQGANTLSAGESQRLKLAGRLSQSTRKRTLFLFDEPTAGLHFADIGRLLDCFDSLLAVGHSLIVVEHNLQMMKAADYLIDLGPGAGENGGRIVVAGAPEEVARCEESATGRVLG